MYYIKKAFFFLFYLMFMDLIGLGIIAIGIDGLALPLAIISIGFYMFIVIYMMFKEGKESMRKLHANDVERVQLLRTGSCGKIDANAEYAPWKGFFIGFLTMSPMILFTIIHLIIELCGGTFMAFGTIVNFMYLGFSCPYQCIAQGVYVGTPLFYIILYAIPVMLALTGVPYLLGAKKIGYHYKMVEEKQRKIYGDKN